MDKSCSPNHAMPNNGGGRLKIAFVGISWPPETFIERLIKELADTGAEITVACDQQPNSSWLPHSRVKWLYVPTWRGSLVVRLARTIRIIPRVLTNGRKDIQRFRVHVKQIQNWRARFYRWYQLLPFAGVRADVIYFPWNSAAISYLPLFDLGCPVVLSCRGSQVNTAPLNPHRSIKQDLLTTFQKAAAVHCVSEAIKREAEQYGLKAKKAKVIRPAVDPEFFFPLHPSKEAVQASVFRITMIGTFIWCKGYEYALQAIRELKDKGINVRLNILGDGPERQRLLYIIDDLELNDAVKLNGRKSPEDVRKVLQCTDAFLLTSLSEGISNAVLEAMACGVPVITTDCGGMREAVTNGVEGFVVPARDSAAIARALADLWEHPDVRLRMGVAGRQRIKKSFALAQQAQAFLSLCRGVTTERVSL